MTRLVHSSDGGRTWSGAEDLRTRFSSYSAVPDRSGGIQVVLDTADEDYGPYMSRVVHACWNGGWSPPRDLFQDRRTLSGAHALGATSQGSISLVWTSGGNPSRIFRSMLVDGSAR